MTFLRPGHTSANQTSGTKQTRSRQRSYNNAPFATPCTQMTATRTDAINRLELELTLCYVTSWNQKAVYSYLAFDYNLTEMIQ